LSGDVDYRRITGDRFANSFDWPSISFNGSGTGIPFFIFSVGGAVVERNEFVNTFSGGTGARKNQDTFARAAPTTTASSTGRRTGTGTRSTARS